MLGSGSIAPRMPVTASWLSERGGAVRQRRTHGPVLTERESLIEPRDGLTMCSGEAALAQSPNDEPSQGPGTAVFLGVDGDGEGVA